MKKTTMLNRTISQMIAEMGHTDRLVICDAGLPIDSQQWCADIALTRGMPDFISTVQAVLSELFIEKILLAEEIKQDNLVIETQLLTLLKTVSQQQGNSIEVEYVPHTVFKQLSRAAKGVVRTGECSPYANVIVYSGVPF